MHTIGLRLDMPRYNQHDSVGTQWIIASKIASLEGENVVYQSEPTLGKRASMELIFSFLRLGDASAKEIYSFARKWGALGIDPHIRGRSDEVILWAESASVWRNLAARLGALLRITNAINSGACDMFYLSFSLCS
jgi:hypothetical protein